MKPAELIGNTIGGYAVEALLGSGGMASVYRGRDLNLQRAVAIKVLADHMATLPGFADRFRQEARLVANLRHPNIVQIYAFGEERGLTYMVQELLPGPTLEQRMAAAARTGAFLEQGEVMAIVTQLAAALDAAHAAGIIHRDVKPANALWNAAQTLVLTDFGIAKDLGEAVTRTQAGMVIGTPSYMAPEQAQGLPLTPATDCYALGVILYELLTNRAPFSGEQPMAVLLQHMRDAPPPPRGLRPDLPPPVEAVVLRALAKEPAQRYASGGAFAAALRQAWAPGGDIHQLATQPWMPAAPAAQPAAPPAPSAQRAARPAAAQAPAARAGGLLLPILGALLLLVFIGAAVLALRGTTGVAEQTPGASATAVTTPVAAEPPAPAARIAAVRELLATAAQDGSAGPQGEALVATVDAAQQALAQGDTATATAQLAALQRTLLAEAQAGALAPDVLRQALTGIDAIAAEHQLALPLAVSE